MRKTFVLDTNVILHNPDALISFADNTVILPIEVLEELDRFKKNHDERGRNARIAIRMLDELRQSGKPGEGVPLESGGTLKVLIGIGRRMKSKVGSHNKVTGGIPSIFVGRIQCIDSTRRTPKATISSTCFPRGKAEM